jgi:hypothetical protein
VFCRPLPVSSRIRIQAVSTLWRVVHINPLLSSLHASPMANQQWLAGLGTDRPSNPEEFHAGPEESLADTAAWIVGQRATRGTPAPQPDRAVRKMALARTRGTPGIGRCWRRWLMSIHIG